MSLKVVLGLIALSILVLAGIFILQNKTNASLISSGEVRRYIIHVPQSYTSDSAVPLVITLHGFADWPAHMARMTGWNKLADEYGFIVVYPSGTGFPKRWRTFNTDKPDSDPMLDVTFISDLLAKLEFEYNIDPKRIYVNGHSNGGAMTTLLACKLSDHIAAIGSVAGAIAFPLEECHPTRSVPLIAFHGTADPIVPYLGGPSHSFEIPFPPAEEWVASWAKLNHCDTSSPLSTIDGEIERTEYKPCAESADVIFYKINEGGHGWPGGKPIPAWIVGYTTQQISATRLIWEFFINHPLEN